MRSLSAPATVAQLRQSSRAQYLEYFELAQNLDGFKVLGWRDEPSAFRGVLYPAFLSFVEDFRPQARPRTPAVEAVLGGLEIPLGGWLALELHSPLAAVAAAALIAFHPALRQVIAPYEIEELYGLLVLLVAIALAAWSRRPTPARAGVLGFAIGTSLLCRSVLFLLPLCLALRPGSGGRRSAWLLVGVSYLLLGPWLARNAYQLQRFVPFEDHAATRNFFAATLGVVENVDVPYQDVMANVVDPGWSASAEMGRMMSLSFKRIAAAPGGYLLSCLRRLGYLLSRHWLVFLLAGLGVVLLRRDRGFQDQGLLCAYFVLAYVPMTLEGRYLKPLLPCLLVLAGCAVAQVAAMAGRLRKPAEAQSLRPSVASAVILALLAPFYLLSAERLAAELVVSAAPCALRKGGLALYHCGSQRARAGDLRAARESWEAALAASERDPSAASALRCELLEELALLDLRQGEAKSARERLTRAAGLDRYEVWRKAIRLQDRRRFPEAVFLLGALTERYPDDAGYLADRGIAEVLAGRAPDGRRSFERALALDPENVRALLNLGVLLEQGGKWREALRLYTRALETAEKSSRSGAPQARYWLHISALRDDLLKRRETGRP